MISGWFDCTEPSLSTSLQGKQGVQGAYAIVRGGSSQLNLIEPTLIITSQRWQQISPSCVCKSKNSELPLKILPEPKRRKCD